jgi:hypothetical protein
MMMKNKLIVIISIMMAGHYIVGIIIPLRILIGFCHSDYKILSQCNHTSGYQLQDFFGGEEGVHGGGVMVVMGGLCSPLYCIRSPAV